jgi:predicted lipid-binding transport protein (Tim44 family)
MASEREREIKRRRQRKAKIKKLRARLAEAGNKAEKEKIIVKIRKISLTAPVE